MHPLNQKNNKIGQFKIDVELRTKLNELKALSRSKNKSCLIWFLIDLAEIKYTMVRDAAEIKVSGWALPGKLEKGWKIKGIDYSNLFQETKSED